MGETDYQQIPNDPAHLLKRQQAYYASGATRDIDGRRAGLRRLERELGARTDAALAALRADLGKPEVEAYLSEIYFLRQEMRLISKRLKRWLKPQRKSSPLYYFPMTSRVELEPHGCVLVMATWNYPLQLALAPIVSAVAAGNTVIVKPSETAGASERFLCELMAACFEPEHVGVVTGGSEVAESLTELDFDFIFFTGSERVGRRVAGRAGSRLIPHVMELGGKCPCVVDETADAKIAAARILTGKLFNAGQTCFAPDFVIVHKANYAPLVTAIERLLGEGRWDHDLARMVNADHYERVKRLAGKTAVVYGEDDPDSLRLAPRLVLQPGWGDACMREEIFGPVLPVLIYEDENELAARLQKLAAPLALYCFSRRRKFVQSVSASLRSGGVCINDTMKQAASLQLPFGGVGNSGYGRYRGEAGVRTFSYQRSIARRFFVRDVFALMPPYGDKIRLLRRWLK